MAPSVVGITSFLRQAAIIHCRCRRLPIMYDFSVFVRKYFLYRATTLSTSSADWKLVSEKTPGPVENARGPTSSPASTRSW